MESQLIPQTMGFYMLRFAWFLYTIIKFQSTRSQKASFYQNQVDNKKTSVLFRIVDGQKCLCRKEMQKKYDFPIEPKNNSKFIHERQKTGRFVNLDLSNTVQVVVYA